MIKYTEDENGAVVYDLWDVALALGITQVRNDKPYVKWQVVKSKLADLGIKTDPMPEFIDADAFLYLLLETNTKAAKDLRRLITVEALDHLAKVLRHA